MPQSAMLRQQYLRLAEKLLARERADVGLSIGSGPDALQRRFRRIEEARALSAELEGAQFLVEEPRLEEFADEYASADHLLQPTLDVITVVIDQAMAFGGWRVNAETYTCVLPTGMFNAQALPTRDGVLVMVNSGLVMLLFQATQTLAHSAEFVSKVSRYGMPTGDPRFGRALYTDDQVLRAFTNALLAYLVFGDSTQVARIPPQGGVRGQLHDVLWSSTNLFAVAHEFGHILGRHVSLGRTKRLETPGWENIDCAAKTFDQEFEADRIGTRLMVALAERARYEQHARHEQAPSIVIAGALVFFALVEAIEGLRAQALGSPRPRDIDHPPPRARATIVREEFACRFGSHEFALADAAVNWIENAANNTIALIRRSTSTTR